jgi:hypothetical protein
MFGASGAAVDLSDKNLLRIISHGEIINLMDTSLRRPSWKAREKSVIPVKTNCI